MMKRILDKFVWYVCVGGSVAYFELWRDLGFWEVIWKSLLVGNLIYLGFLILSELYQVVLSRFRFGRAVLRSSREEAVDNPVPRHPLRVALEERGISLNVDVDDMPVAVIKASQRPPDPDPNVEECDVWVDTEAEPPRMYVRTEVSGEEPAWSVQDINVRGRVGIIQDDTLVLARCIRSPALSRVMQNLAEAKEATDLKDFTVQALDDMDDDVARELCIMSGFDPNKWKDARTPAMGGNVRRTIDLG